MSILIKPSGNSKPQMQIEREKLFDNSEEQSIDNAADLSYELNVDTIPFDAEIEAARQQYCEASGKPLCKVNAETVHNLITIHGHETTIKILLTQQKQVSLEWIWLNNEGLDKLALHSPREYLVYSASKLLQDITLHSELMRLHEAANAWKKLQSIDETIIPPINELIRRLLAGYQRKLLNKHLAKFKFKKIDEIATSTEALMTFQMELTNLIQLLIEKKKKKEVYHQGMTAFKMQSMITALSELEMSVGKEFNDFDIVDGKSVDSIHAIVGTKYQHSSDKRKVKYSTTATKTKLNKPFKLNLGGSE